DRGEFDRALALLKGLETPEARKLRLETRREKDRLSGDAADSLAALRELIRSFPDDAEYSDWVEELAERDKESARPLEPSLRRSVERWGSDPGLGAAGYDPGDLLYNLASFLDDIGETKAAKEVWSRVADAYAAQAAKSPLAVPRAANFGRAEALMKAGRSAEAEALYRKLLAAYPDEFTFNYDYAWVLLDRGEAARAYPYAVKAAESGYGDNWLRAVRLKAEIELKLGRASDAARTIDSALAETVPPKTTEVRTDRYLEELRALRRKVADAAKG
ncbi:MAG: tetratricopeptide repeat protein, partial [Elusimicrobia bacterium]|nr:tetratricopeptide repeat protein [Elusimicrobiota bacterium]